MSEINLLALGYGKFATQSQTDRPASYDRYARNVRSCRPFSARRMTFWLRPMHPRSSSASRPWRTTRGRSNSRACGDRRRRRRRFRYLTFAPCVCSTFPSISVDRQEKCHPPYGSVCCMCIGNIDSVRLIFHTRLEIKLNGKSSVIIPYQ